MVIKLKDVNYQIPNGDTVYENLNFELELGEFIGVLGKNGAGKTTLIDLLMGYRPITTGEIKVMGEDPMAMSRRNKKDIIKFKLFQWIFILSFDKFTISPIYGFFYT